MITILTADPAKLLKEIDAAIADGTIKMWTVDSEGDFSHTDAQLAGKGFFLRPEVRTDALMLRALFTGEVADMAKRRAAYAILHGDFVKMIVTHFHQSVMAEQAITITAVPINLETVT